MRCDWLWSLPAVSASTTSQPRARAAASASNTTAPGSAPGSCAAIDHERLRTRREDCDYDLAQGANQRRAVGELVTGDAEPEVLEDPRSRFDPHVGGKQARLELFQDLRIDAAPADELAEIAGQPGVTTVQALTNARQEPRA
jgi:hypothetical protein